MSQNCLEVVGPEFKLLVRESFGNSLKILKKNKKKVWQDSYLRKTILN